MLYQNSWKVQQKPAQSWEDCPSLRESGKGAYRTGTKPSEQLQKAMSEDFGSFDKWKEDFVASGMAARGWGMLCYGLDDGKLHNVVLDAQNAGFPATVVPLVLMDVYEHAYFIDYGTGRKGYIEAFFKNLNWDRVSRRYEKCVRMHKIWNE